MRYNTLRANNCLDDRMVLAEVMNLVGVCASADDAWWWSSAGTVAAVLSGDNANLFFFYGWSNNIEWTFVDLWHVPNGVCSQFHHLGRERLWVEILKGRYINFDWLIDLTIEETVLQMETIRFAQQHIKTEFEMKMYVWLWLRWS